jgi:D-alanine-D-alanine ligase
MAGVRITDPGRFGRVAVLMGGTSSEREVSLDSGGNVLSALQRRGVRAESVDGIPALVERLVGKRVDRVFNILHGQRGGGEDGVVQGLLEAFGVPYTGSDVLGSALSMDKIRTKQVWLSLGLPTPRYTRVSPNDDVAAAARSIGLPVVVKPASEGSSVGVSRVFEERQLGDAVALAKRYPGEVLIEELIQGDEYTVSILGDRALPSIRIVPATGYYDYHAKYVADTTQYICPGLDGPAEQEIGLVALRAFQAAGCRHWGRVDIMRDRGGANYLLEINTSPGMTSHSLVPKAARAVGIEFDDLVWQILEMTL